ncbi:hypothetical protein [Nocardioides marmoribigeumensis]|uniref:Proteinase inhibitor I42 chagasin domain-containing protein n=1 Tax=Nocardioides marmoribigeumensis TaxID=433649 RepID=A0ABU2BXU5_9ACTN|nr:hypothetical protein [Nocardioides marmoribigeumensis]MDR7363233.1 hypothetical protein [Nocardioides marmoribigeumensis]
MRVRLLAGAALSALAALAACGSDASRPVATPTGATGATGSSVSATTHVVRLSEATAGRTVRVRRGDRVTLTLHNTYWRIAPAADGALEQVEQQVDRPAPPGTCRPGVGCGTVRTRYVAVSPGAVRLTASRTSCGEAMACPPGQGRYAVTVEVG